jgi:hypothetical protein
MKEAVRAGCNIGRGIGHIEEDDELSAWLALETATMLFHELVAGWASRCHWAMGTPETVNSFSRAQDTIAARYILTDIGGECCSAEAPS